MVVSTPLSPIYVVTTVVVSTPLSPIYVVTTVVVSTPLSPIYVMLQAERQFWGEPAVVS